MLLRLWPPQGQGVTGDRDALIEEALELTGITKQLAGLAAQVTQNTNLGKSPLDAKERAALLQALAAAFGAEPILAPVRGVLRKDYDPQLMGGFVAQLRTPPLGRRLDARGGGARPPAGARRPGSRCCRRRGAPSQAPSTPRSPA